MKKLAMGLLIGVFALEMSACTLVGATAGAAAGHATTHDTAGTVGGAVVGGVIGYEIGKNRNEDQQ